MDEVLGNTDQFGRPQMRALGVGGASLSRGGGRVFQRLNRAVVVD